MNDLRFQIKPGMTSEEERQEGNADVDLQDKIKLPKRYVVLLHNDDYTTMEFVILVLQKFFKHTVESAYTVMMTVHATGQGAAGVYSFDIAETKSAQVMEFARTSGFPLRCSVEPEFDERSQ